MVTRSGSKRRRRRRRCGRRKKKEKKRGRLSTLAHEVQPFLRGHILRITLFELHRD
jgi:hypothetical protein